jgi:hypothetical protein
VLKVVNTLLTVVSVLLVFCVVSAAPNPPQFINTTHRIMQGTIILPPMVCSATAIAPHALLTASHCEQPSSNILVDGKLMIINSIIRDGWDHSIYLLDGPEFKDYAKVLPNAFEVGDEVEYNGNPGELINVFRRGYIAGHRFIPTSRVSGYVITLIDVNGYFGDSGAGVFNTKGELVTVVNTMETEGSVTETYMKLVGAFDLKFTPEEYKQAADFKGRP